MIRELLCIFFLVPCLWADGPKFKHADNETNQEFVNTYQDIRSLLKGEIGPLTITSMTVTSGTFTSIQASSASFTNMTVSVSTITRLSVGTIVGASFGKILQVVQGNTTTSNTTTSSSFQNSATTVNITPTSASSRVWISAYAICQVSVSGGNMWVTFIRDSTNIGNATNGILNCGNNTNIVPASLGWVDSPATTSQITYRVGFRSDGVNTARWNATDGIAVIIAAEVGP